MSLHAFLFGAFCERVYIYFVGGLTIIHEGRVVLCKRGTVAPAVSRRLCGTGIKIIGWRWAEKLPGTGVRDDVGSYRQI